MLINESLSERAEIQRQQLLEKLSNRETSSVRSPYMDMNGRSKGEHFSPYYSFYFVFTIFIIVKTLEMISKYYLVGFYLVIVPNKIVPTTNNILYDMNN